MYESSNDYSYFLQNSPEEDDPDPELEDDQDMANEAAGPLPEIGILKHIAKLTDNYALTYRGVKDSPLLQEPAFQGTSADRLKELIHNGRKKAIRMRTVTTAPVDTGCKTTLLGKKRQRSKVAIDSNYKVAAKSNTIK